MTASGLFGAASGVWMTVSSLFGPTAGSFGPAHGFQMPSSRRYKPPAAPFNVAQGSFGVAHGFKMTASSHFKPTAGVFKPTSGAFNVARGPFNAAHGFCRAAMAEYKAASGPFSPAATDLVRLTASESRLRVHLTRRVVPGRRRRTASLRLRFLPADRLSALSAISAVQFRSVLTADDSDDRRCQASHALAASSLLRIDLRFLRCLL